jgi:hypothetical protein
MALTTYSELQTAVGTWLGRSDLSDSIPDFISAFEAHANRVLRTRQMQSVTTMQLTSGVGTLPTDYLNWRRVTWTGSTRVELAYRHPQYVQARYPNSAAGTPQVFTIEGSTLYVRPVDDTDLEFLYLQKIPSLSVAAPTNWLITAHPDAYLFGALVEATTFVADDRAQLWKARRDEVVDEIQKLSNVSDTGGEMRVWGYSV